MNQTGLSFIRSKRCCVSLLRFSKGIDCHQAIKSLDNNVVKREFHNDKGNITLDATTVTSANPKYVRLSKLISENSPKPISRREAERLIRGGSVKLAGEIVTIPQRLLSKYDYKNGALTLNDKALNIMNTNDFTNDYNNIDDNETISSSSSSSQLSIKIPRVFIVHKVTGELVTENDPKNRPSIFDRLRRAGIEKSISVYLKPIGRLDMNTEGLLILTSCGLYSREMELPINLLHRTYRVRVHGILNQYKISQIQNGKIYINGSKYKPMKVIIDNNDNKRKKKQIINRGRRHRNESTDNNSRNNKDHRESTNHWIQITCCEGKNRQIRNVLKCLGLTVTRLIRISYGDYQLHNIPPGMAIEVPYKSIDKQKRKGPLDIIQQLQQKPSSFDQQQQQKQDSTLNNANSSRQESHNAIPIEWIRNV